MGYMMSHPGKKLTFMGCEFGQFKEWAYKEGLEFFLKDYEKHNKLSVFNADLNKFYLSEPCLYGDDDGWDGFTWLVADDSDNNVFAYVRRYKGKELICIVNFSGENKNYRLGVDSGKYQVVFNSDKIRYGGDGVNKKRVYKTQKIEWQGKESSFEILLPALSFTYLKKSI